MTEEEMQPIYKKSIKLANRERGMITHSRIAILSHLILFYALAFGIWGIVLKINFLWAVLAGVIFGLIISFTLCLPTIIVKPKNPEELGDKIFFVGIWVKFAIVIGISGLIFWLIKALFLR